MKQSLQIEQVQWHQPLRAQLKDIRTQVFINEQHVPVALEWDDEDDAAKHLLATTMQGIAVGCARILNDGKIGRMAVLKPYRNQGIGRALLNHAISICKIEYVRNIQLSAQIQVIPFYEKAGFKVKSQPYLDAGIWHVDMVLAI